MSGKEALDFFRAEADHDSGVADATTGEFMELQLKHWPVPIDRKEALWLFCRQREQPASLACTPNKGFHWQQGGLVSRCAGFFRDTIQRFAESTQDTVYQPPSTT